MRSYRGCLMEGYSDYRDPAWISKYTDMKRYDKNGKEAVMGNIEGYLCNLFAFPFGYFEQRTAEELNLTEEDRQTLIRMQDEAKEKKKILSHCEDLYYNERPTGRRVIGFQRADDDVGFLSNWYMSDFRTDCWHTFSSMEQYIMYQKAVLFNDKETARKILSVNDPAVIKHLGRTVKNYIDSVWCGHRQIILLEGLMAKFGQNPKLKVKLLDTCDSVLTECVASDCLWAIGLDINDERRCDIKYWRGQNLLGYTLMEARGQLSRG